MSARQPRAVSSRSRYAGRRAAQRARLCLPCQLHSRPRTARPDEHRFQIKYGGNLSGVIDIAVDPLGVTTTIFIGIDLERKVFVAVDPLMNNPSPMSRSVEFKTENVERILAESWCAWERDRREAKTTTRRAFELLPDIRTEILIGGRQERLLDLILLERVARWARSWRAASYRRQVPRAAREARRQHGLPQAARRAEHRARGTARSHQLREPIEDGRARLGRRDASRDAPQGAFDGVTECIRLQGDGKPDISLRWKGSKPILIECKNVLRTTYAGGVPKLDFQRTRAAKSDPCSRYYMPSDFQVVAACLHPVTEQWEFRFALTSELPAARELPGPDRQQYSSRSMTDSSQRTSMSVLDTVALTQPRRHARCLCDLLAMSRNPRNFRSVIILPRLATFLIIALPHDEHVPTQLIEAATTARFVTTTIALKLRSPILRLRSRQLTAVCAVMTMPKAAVHENHLAMTREHDIRDCRGDPIRCNR